MARVTARVRYLNSVGQDAVDHKFLNAGGVADIDTQVVAIQTSGSTVATDLATCITNAGTSAGSLGLTQLNTDWSTLSGLINTAVTSAGKDLVVSFDSSVLNTKSKLKQALDHAYLVLAGGGQAGLTS